MSYQVLALKWRPMKFEDVVGQDHVTRTLQNAIRQERVSHAFLFTGGRGVGKTTTARILAKSLICKEGPTPEPCGVCPFCTEVRDGRSLDVMEIDGASNTGVDNIRELRENAGYSPAAARFKIYIIDEVHMLSTSAFNALLKTLEEPPAHVKFIFATTEVNKVPITIQSRCQRFDFRLLTREEILGQLKKIVAEEKIEIGEESLLLIAGAAEGSLRDSQTLLDQVLAYSGKKVGEKDVYEALGIAEEKTTLEFLAGLVGRKADDCMRILDRLAGSGFDPKTFTGEVLTGLRNLTILKVSDGLEELVPVSKEGLKSLKTLAAAASPGRIQSLFDVFLQAEKEIRSTTYPRMLLELAVLRAVRVEELEELRLLVDRLEALEGRIPAGNSAGTPPREAATPAPPPEPGSRIEYAPPPNLENGDEEGAADEGAFVSAEPNPDSRSELFGRIVEKVKKEKVLPASFLEHGKLTGVEEDQLEISFDAGNGLFIETLKETDNMALLREVASDILGRKVKVRLVEETAGAEGKGAQMARESDLKKKQRREALEHPLIQGVLEVFQAQLVDVKIL